MRIVTASQFFFVPGSYVAFMACSAAWRPHPPIKVTSPVKCLPKHLKQAPWRHLPYEHYGVGGGETECSSSIMLPASHGS